MSDDDFGRPTDNRVARWLLLSGDRERVASLLVVGVVALTAALTFGNVIYVGPDSALATVLGSGLLSALATIVTVTLSINQLILSRVFGMPADLTDRLEGNLDFRRSIEEIAGVDTSPNDPGSFLALVAGTLEERAASLERHVDDSAALSDDQRERVDALTEDLVAYADHLSAGDQSGSTLEVLLLTFGTEYADRIDDVRGLQRGLADHLSAESADAVDDILELLKGVAVVRQFFKTLAVQQDLAALSRQLVYTGVPALLLNYYLAQVYTASGSPPAIPAAWLPWVTTAAAGVLFAPLVVLVVYVLRVATVTLYTVSVGSFIPPEERAQ
ncbi:hypothetical protein [Haloarcula litorea]|uniref:hypothetical protein n=1 Tax=Haloarcula litorea TaxID=3032579 RepID=UPI0023E789FA|nr:hypothetical protein [Halomicroarcula sp. GDY20]